MDRKEKNFLGFIVSIVVGAIVCVLFVIQQLFPNEFMAFFIQHEIVFNILGGFVLFILIVIFGFVFFIYERD
ncbi:hypothetical protein ABU952_18655 [Bacillus amyloliquefaciens]|uniref:hypothetical protein n=1 Tax=Bacillus TaxID=1386 RepID=UPI001ABDF565|nr:MULTISPECIES: hypothetical protein [Bacillus]MBR7817991.1 hypothetical protein [Bacillus sp. CCNWLCWHY013]MDJ0479949.1 hypothetical protein [Bacillus amyloliquefaciens]QTG87467.1 hypothetical protein J4048_21800 [Bacillus amyloliquefaciens]